MAAAPAEISITRQAAQFARFLDREEARWVRPAAAILAREGARAAQAYLDGGEDAALDSVSEEDWTRYLWRVWISTVPRAGEFVTDAIEPMKAAAPPDPFMQAALSHLRMNGAGRVKGITQTSKDEIGNQIRIGVQKGESRDEIAARIVKHRRSITPERAQTIARTEVHAAANYGSLVAAELVTVPMEKIWIARADARDAHRAASGQRRALDAAFVVGGYRMMHPGDGSFLAPAGLIVNCRCVMSFQVKRSQRPRRSAA
jgi:hypothetical protein